MGRSDPLAARVKKLLLTVTCTAMLASLAEAQQVPDPRVADLAQAGKIRVGVNSVLYKKDPQTGELKAAGSGSFFSTSLAHWARGSELRSCWSDIRPFPRC